VKQLTKGGVIKGQAGQRSRRQPPLPKRAVSLTPITIYNLQTLSGFDP